MPETHSVLPFSVSQKKVADGNIARLWEGNKFSPCVCRNAMGPAGMLLEGGNVSTRRVLMFHVPSSPGPDTKLGHPWGGGGSGANLQV